MAQNGACGYDGKAAVSGKAAPEDGSGASAVRDHGQSAGVRRAGGPAAGHARGGVRRPYRSAGLQHLRRGAARVRQAHLHPARAREDGGRHAGPARLVLRPQFRRPPSPAAVALSRRPGRAVQIRDGRVRGDLEGRDAAPVRQRRLSPPQERHRRGIQADRSRRARQNARAGGSAGLGPDRARRWRLRFRAAARRACAVRRRIPQAAQGRSRAAQPAHARIARANSTRRWKR